MKQKLILSTLLFLGVLSAVSVSVMAAPSDNANPAQRALDVSAAFNDGVFADDWSPGSDESDDSSEDDSSSDGDQPATDIGAVFSGGVFADDWTPVPDQSDDSSEEDGSDAPDEGSDDAPSDGDNSSDGDAPSDDDDNSSDDDQSDDGDAPDDGDSGDSDRVSHEYVAELWGGTTPWEGVQENEHICFTHFHRDAFDESHCGWDLDVEEPPQLGDSATEDRTLTPAPAPESLGIEWISYPNPRDVMPDPYTAQDEPSIKVCTVLLNQDNEVITGETVDNAEVSMDIGGVPYGEAHPATFDLPLTQYSDMIGANENMPEGDGWLDSECMEFANLAPGSFTYSEPAITGSDSQDIEFVGVTEYWNQQNVGEPFDKNVDAYGATDLSDGEFSLGPSHDRRHIELVYVFRLN